MSVVKVNASYHSNKQPPELFKWINKLDVAIYVLKPSLFLSYIFYFSDNETSLPELSAEHLKIQTDGDYI